ncbi:hypothetical protein GE09DRAFT_211488 [Coniochaeta sp. 2T2.1]|nr:hypothetical protein GE09DRAFT_211488 [Coniochaeta sp. 2T2.1]
MQFGFKNKSPEYLAKFPRGHLFLPRRERRQPRAPKTAVRRHRRGEMQDPRVDLVRQAQFDRAVVSLISWRWPVVPIEPEANTEFTRGEEIKRWLEYMEGHLKGRKWFAGGDDAGPSLADLTIGRSLDVGLMLYIDDDMRVKYPEVMGFYRRLMAVPGLGEVFKLPELKKRQEVPEELGKGIYVMEV